MTDFEDIDPDLNHFDILTDFPNETLCKYYTMNDFNSIAKDNYSDFTIFTYNIRIFNAHIDDLHSLFLEPKSLNPR